MPLATSLKINVSFFLFLASTCVIIKMSARYHSYYFKLEKKNIFKHLMHTLGGCVGRKLDIAILGDRSRSLTRDDLVTFRKVVVNMVKKVGVAPKAI